MRFVRPRDPPEAISEMARVVRAGGWVATYMWDIPGGGAPTDPIYVALESMGMTSVRPANPVVSGREVMQDLWEKAGLKSIDTQVIRIPIVYRDFDDFWESNTVLIGPQGKIISGMSTSERETPHRSAQPSAYRFGRTHRLRIIRERREGTGTRLRPLTGASDTCVNVRYWHKADIAAARIRVPRPAQARYERPASSRNACTASNSIMRFFSMMMVCVPSGSCTRRLPGAFTSNGNNVCPI